MTPLIPLDDGILVAGQIRPADIGAIADAGVTLIVDNRPDGEELGQPDAAEIERAAAAEGIAFRHVPFQGLPHPAAVQAVADALGGANGTVLLFCRSGTRSTWAWALARARGGADVDDLIATAAAAGYDLSALPLYLS